jgi:GAF domain-containing protein
MSYENFSTTPEQDIDLTLNGIRHAIALHWKAYYSLPPEERLGDQERWDDQILLTLRELGVVDEQVALDINEIAKFEAQFL